MRRRASQKPADQRGRLEHLSQKRRRRRRRRRRETASSPPPPPKRSKHDRNGPPAARRARETQGKGRKAPFKRRGETTAKTKLAHQQSNCSAAQLSRGEARALPRLCSIAVQTPPAEAAPRRASFRRQRPERAPRSPEAAGGKIPAASRKRRFFPRRIRPEITKSGVMAEIVRCHRIDGEEEHGKRRQSDGEWKYITRLNRK